MAAFHDITADQLRQVIHLRERIEFLQNLLSRLRSGTKRKAGVTGKKMQTTRRAQVGKPVAKKKGGLTGVTRRW